MFEPVELAIIASHQAHPEHALLADVACLHNNNGLFDAVDAVLRDAAGEMRIFGARMRPVMDAYIDDRAAYDEVERGAGLLPVTFDPAAVEHWDFNAVLWVGPADHPCLFWSNALAISVEGLLTFLAISTEPETVERSGLPAGPLLAGPDGKGLPSPAVVGREVDATTLEWMPVPS